MKHRSQNTGNAESAVMELKSSFNASVIESLAAFANTKGGSVLIGVADNGEPTAGFRIGKETIALWINEIKTKTQPSLVPDVQMVNVKGKTAVQLSIPEYPVKPVACKGKYYTRNLETMNVAGAPQPQFDVQGNIFKGTVYPVTNHAAEKKWRSKRGLWLYLPASRIKTRDSGQRIGHLTENDRAIPETAKRRRESRVQRRNQGGRVLSRRCERGDNI